MYIMTLFSQPIPMMRKVYSVSTYLQSIETNNRDVFKSGFHLMCQLIIAYSNKERLLMEIEASRGNTPSEQTNQNPHHHCHCGLSV